MTFKGGKDFFLFHKGPNKIKIHITGHSQSSAAGIIIE